MLIGISGGSGSGKTYFMRKLSSFFDINDVSILSMDEYYKPRNEQFIDENGIKNFDLPTSIDIDHFVRDIKTLMDGKSIEKKKYTFNNEHAEEAVLTLNPSKILIVEGLFIFSSSQVAELLDLSIIIHADDALKIIRRIKRDNSERNYPLDDVLYRYEHHVKPAYEKYIEPHLDEVDMVINNNHSVDKAVDVLAGYISHTLDNMDKNE